MELQVIYSAYDPTRQTSSQLLWRLHEAVKEAIPGPIVMMMMMESLHFDGFMY